MNTEQNKPLTLGSLFDGSGGFPLGGLLTGQITSLWSSEIEPFAIRVTTKRLPWVKHYGDVSAISGADLPPVDIITFGSPCQDMSIAGKRDGLDGSRSSLFYEAIRIVKEMRCKTNGEKPRFIVWENVPGAFSSNKGQDFKAVLEAVIGVKEPAATVPAPEKKGWPDADYYVGDGWSVAYRVLDAQWWGVPQRRKRIYLVADFADQSAPKVLFESEGMSRYSAEGFRAWQRAAAGAEGSIGETGCCGFDGYNGCLTGNVSSTIGENCGMSTGRNSVVVLNDQGGTQMDVSEDVTGTLRTQEHGHQPCVLEAAGFCTEHSANARSIGYEEERSPTLRARVVPAAIALENHPADSRVKISEDGKVQTLTSRCGTGGGNVPMVMDTVENSPAVTLKIRSGCEGGGKGAIWQEEKSATLGCNNDQTLFVPKCYGVCSKASHSMMSDNPHSGFYEAETSRTLDRSGRADVIIVARGGGSREDLWVFNAEVIARAAYRCKKPLISAIGHEIDYTILDFVADRRAPTPSAAAELAVPDREEQKRILLDLQQNIRKNMQKRFDLCYNGLEQYNFVLEQGLARRNWQKSQGQLQQVQDAIRQQMQKRLHSAELQLGHAAALTGSLDPYKVLARGYTMVTAANGTILNADDLQPEKTIYVRSASRRAKCRVEAVEEINENTQKF